MNNRNMVTSLLAIGATGAAIYGITRGVQNGTFQKLPQQVTNALQNTMNNQQMAQQPIQNIMNNQKSQQQQTNSTQSSQLGSSSLD